MKQGAEKKKEKKNQVRFTGASGLGISYIQDFVASFLFPRHSDHNDEHTQLCLRHGGYLGHNGFGRCDEDDSIWEVLYESEEIEKEDVYGECCVEIIVVRVKRNCVSIDHHRLCQMTRVQFPPFSPLHQNDIFLYVMNSK